MTEEKQSTPVAEPGDLDISIKTPGFIDEMSDTFEDGLIKAVENKSDIFAFDYLGGDGSPMGCTDKMKCIVILWPAPLAELMLEGLTVVKARLIEVAEQAARGEFEKGKLKEVKGGTTQRKI